MSGGATSKIKGSISGSSNSGSTSPSALLGVERDFWPDTDPQERFRYHKVFDRVLAQLGPVCLEEQRFAVSFFQLDILSPTTKVHSL